MILLSRRIHDKISNFVMWLDYVVYLIFNPFKFKRFPKDIKKILIVELLQLGDLLVITPALRALKDKFKDAKIDVLVNKNTRDLLCGNKNINKILTYETFKNLMNKLRQNNYDIGVILHHGSFIISLALLLGKVKYRIGCTKVGLFSGKGFFLNKKIKPKLKWQHKIQDNLDVVRSIGVNTNNYKLEIHTDDNSREYVKKLFISNKIYERPIIGIHPYSKHYTQRWYCDRFVKLADELIKNYKATIIFTGSKGEDGYVNEIIQNMTEEPINLVGKTSLKQFIAIVEKLDLLISIDTSAIHIASALNKPVIALFGPTIPQFWGPTSDKSVAIWKPEVCTGCRRYYCAIKTHECMKSITVEDIKSYTNKILKK